MRRSGGKRVRNQVLCGAVAGVAGAVVMTIPIVVSQRLRLFHTPPPEEISDNVARRTWLLPDPSHRVFPVLWIAAHLGYGATCGTLFSLLRRWLPGWLPGSARSAGPVFGLSVWAVGYLGFVPALRLYPWPANDSRPRQVVMIVAHGLFGLTVAGVDDRLRQGAH